MISCGDTVFNFLLNCVYLQVHSIDNFTFQIIFRGSTETVLILRAPR